MNEKEKIEELNRKSAEKGNENTQLSEEEQKKLDQILKLAKKPVVLKDSEFKLAPRELDIRHLSDKNYKQMQFRMECHKVALLKGIHDDLVDVMRLEMLILKKLGVANITDALEELSIQISDEVKDEVNKVEKSKN